MSASPSPRIVIVGRPNVGKSTLFNRLLGRKRALVHDEPGVTRDRLIEQAVWKLNRKTYQVELVDTGGLGEGRFSEEIAFQVKQALEMARIVLVVMDGEEGFTFKDKELLKKFRAKGIGKDIPWIGVINKIDDNKHEDRVDDFYAAGMDELFGVSAEHSRGITDLQLRVLELIGEDAVSETHSDENFEADEDDFSDSDEQDGSNDSDSEDESSDEDHEEEVDDYTPTSGPLKIAIVGRPNVGKSTLTNAILGEERMIVSPIAGTTVDSIDSEVTIDGITVQLIDTAGVRRKSKTERGVEVLSVVQTKKALERCHVAVLVLNGEEGVVEQDEKIGSLIEEAGCGVILAMNKWDTQRHNKDFKREDAAERIRSKMAYLKYAPILFTSGLQRKGWQDIIPLAQEIWNQRQVKVKTNEFTNWVKRESEVHNPENARFYLSHQSGRHPPTFVCHVSDPEKIKFSLRRHLVNAIRERWGFMGNPIRMVFIAGKSERRAKTPAELARRSHQKRERARKWAATR